MKPRLSAILFAFICTLTFLLPVLWMTVIALKQNAEKINSFVDWFSPPYTFDNLVRILRDTMLLQWLSNSLIVAVLHSLLVIVLCSLTAYALSKLNLPGGKWIYLLIIAGMMIPVEVIAIAQFQVAKNLHLLNTLTVLIIPGAAAPFTVIVLKVFMDAIPKELMESAEIDGAGKFTIFWRMIIPIGSSSLFALGILAFLQSWNSFLWPFLVITDMTKFTLPVGIPTLLSSFTVDYVTPMAISLLSSLPAIIFFLIFQKKIVKGIAFTGIKG
ncbi:carbohydrate ABC transporter permease [Paenibacillus sp. FSL R10-2734]|uniref:carbohydrate ABC transporter permease n=1 Tax=Paenibacillus sp. FSL R10-2734 TaxID=2954691 RepID=UPI0030D9382C